MPRRDVDQLRKLVEKRGFRVVPSGSGHWKVLGPNGAVIQDDNGPVIMSSSSSETRGRTMAVKRLMAAGILNEDPWAPTSKKAGENGAQETERERQEREQHEREMEATRAGDQERARRTQRIRERLEPIIVRLGGWDKRGVKKNLGDVAHYYAGRMQLRDRWASPQAATENADSIRAGATLSPAMASLWEHLLGELEKWPDTALRFVQLQREAKGLDMPSIGEEPIPFTRSTTEAPAARPVRAESSLALRVMFEMTRVFDIIQRAWGTISGDHASVSVMKGLAWILERNSEKLDTNRLVDRLQVEGSIGVMRKAYSHQAAHQGSLWVNWYRAAVESYNTGLPEGKRLEWFTSGRGGVGQSRLLEREVAEREQA